MNPKVTNPISLIRFTLLLVLLFTALYAKEKSDYLIVENPEQLQILNRYQQKVREADQLNLMPFMPWKIISRDMLLSDGFSGAMEVEFNGRIFFLVLNEENELIAQNSNNDIRIIEQVTAIEDMYRIERDKSVLFSKIPINQRDPRFPRNYLQKGDLLKAVFKKGPDYFVFRIDESQYGWIRYSGYAVKKLEPKEVEQEVRLPQTAITRVREKLDDLNNLFRKLYSDLNESYSVNNNTPVLTMESSNNHITINLPTGFAENYSKSLTYLINDLENILIGSPFSVVRTNDVLEIKTKEQTR